MAKSGDDLGKFLKLMEEKLGSGLIRRGLCLEDGGILPCSVISTQCLSLDRALGVGGLPRERITEIYGPEGSGKTTLATHVVAEAQRLGERAAYVDVEHAVDPSYCKSLGVNVRELFFSQPDSGEQAMELMRQLIVSKLFGVVVLDSVAALAPQAELDGEIGDHVIGAQARLMSKSLRAITSSLSNSKCCVIFINQIREKIGFMVNPGSTTTSGGRALRFYSSIRLEIKRTGSEMIDKVAIANKVTAKVVKNKVAPPFQSADFHIFFGKGIKRSAEVFALAQKLKLVERSGSWYKFGDKNVGLGFSQSIDALDNDMSLLKELEDKVKEKLIIVPTTTEDEPMIEEVD